MQTRVITVTALAFVSLFAIAAGSAKAELGWSLWTLTPEKTQFNWDSWDVKINNLTFRKSVQRFSEETADSDSIFVYLDLTVKNTGTKGNDFIPQNRIKLIIGENTFDAEDLDERVEYLRNIEPTLVRNRKCYFEIPISMQSGPFTLRFEAPSLFGGEVVTVAVISAKPEQRRHL
jgi:hypothetical protein